MQKELDQLLYAQIDCLRSNIDELNQILIDLSKCERSYQMNKIIDNIEKNQTEFTKNINEHQKYMKNFIEIYKMKKANITSKAISHQQQSFNPILGIDLGTSNSIVGYYRLNSRKRGELNIVSYMENSQSIPSVVCIVNDKIYVGKNAIEMSIKYPKNLIYDTKRMLGKKYDDPLIQKYKKSWTFDIVPSKEREILIKVDNKYYEPYQISGMILIELMNLANSQLDDQTNQAIITIPAYFSKEQIDDTKKAAKYANIELIELLKEPLAATYCYGYRTNNNLTSANSRDILIYDFGGGTLDVSYVEVKGSSFKILAADGDPNLGGQDFTNSIYEIISPKLDNYCHTGWRQNSYFIKKVKEICEDAKIKLSSLNEYEIYFDIQKDVARYRNTPFEYVLKKEEFQEKTKSLFDRCMNPVKKVLNEVKKKKSFINIESLVLVGGSSYLPMILDKLSELTHKKANRGVSAFDAVAFGACVIGGHYIQQKMIELNQKSDKTDEKDMFLLKMEVINHQSSNEIPVTATIGIVKYKKDTIKENKWLDYYEGVIEEGFDIPYSKEILIYNNNVKIDPKNKQNIEIPVYKSLNESKTIIGKIIYKIPSKDIRLQDAPLLKIRLTQDKNGISYAYKRPDEEKYSKTEILPDIGNSLVKDDTINELKETQNQEQRYSSISSKRNSHEDVEIMKPHSESTRNDNTMPLRIVPSDIEIYTINDNSNPMLYGKFEKGDHFPCKPINFTISGSDLNIQRDQKQINIHLYLVKNEKDRFDLPVIELPITSNDRNIRQKLLSWNFEFKWDSLGFRCNYKKNYDNNQLKNLPINNNELQKFLYQ
ncbi:Heat shock protein ssb1 [Tritrichomonas musculus]|uniref:Heat shock protein ssb1 n=1 Tax=Tritrichomonas musculus TaxID=1915356 RepID=A0ABR2KEE3_9EUKA